jgi:hypothetical protein
MLRIWELIRNSIQDELVKQLPELQSKLGVKPAQGLVPASSNSRDHAVAKEQSAPPSGLQNDVSNTKLPASTVVGSKTTEAATSSSSVAAEATTHSKLVTDFTGKLAAEVRSSDTEAAKVSYAIKESTKVLQEFDDGGLFSFPVSRLSLRFCYCLA